MKRLKSPVEFGGASIFRPSPAFPFHEFRALPVVNWARRILLVRISKNPGLTYPINLPGA